MYSILFLCYDDFQVLDVAKAAWNRGQGIWPQMRLKQRIAAVRGLVASLKVRREEIVNALMWEIGKTTEDAASEFDRTMAFIESTIAAYIEMDDADGKWRVVSEEQQRRGQQSVIVVY